MTSGFDAGSQCDHGSRGSVRTPRSTSCRAAQVRSPPSALQQHRTHGACEGESTYVDTGPILASARTPQVPQPANLCGRPDRHHHFGWVSTTSSTRKPSRTSIATARPSEVLLVGRRATTTMAGPLAAQSDLFLRQAPRFTRSAPKLTLQSCYDPTDVPVGRAAPRSCDNGME